MTAAADETQVECARSSHLTRLRPLPPRLQATPDPKLRLLMSSMAECVRTIAYKARGSTLAVDVDIDAGTFCPLPLHL